MSPHTTHLEHRLNPNFSLAELTVSQAAARAGLRNVPVGTALANLHRLALFLEQVRSLLFNAPILVSSGFRSPAVNNLVGGSLSSAHMQGLAADFIAPKYGRPKVIAEALRDSALPFDQLIFEGTWVHVAIAATGAAPRRDVLTAQRATCGGSCDAANTRRAPGLALWQCAGGCAAGAAVCGAAGAAAAGAAAGTRSAAPQKWINCHQTKSLS